jgi:hypothetical protein
MRVCHSLGTPPESGALWSSAVLPLPHPISSIPPLESHSIIYVIFLSRSEEQDVVVMGAGQFEQRSRLEIQGGTPKPGAQVSRRFSFLLLPPPSWSEPPPSSIMFFSLSTCRRKSRESRQGSPIFLCGCFKFKNLERQELAPRVF